MYSSIIYELIVFVIVVVGELIKFYMFLKGEVFYCLKVSRNFVLFRFKIFFLCIKFVV